MGLTLSNPCAIVSHQKLDRVLPCSPQMEQTKKPRGSRPLEQRHHCLRDSVESTKRREDDDATYGWVSKSGCPFRRVHPFEKKSWHLPNPKEAFVGSSSWGPGCQSHQPAACPSSAKPGPHSLQIDVSLNLGQCEPKHLGSFLTEADFHLMRKEVSVVTKDLWESCCVQGFKHLKQKWSNGFCILFEKIWA